MATIAEMLLGSALESSQQTPDLAGNFAKGAELGLQIEATRQRREQLEVQKQEHYLSKINRVMDAIESGSQFKDKAAQNMFFKNYVPSMVKALKVDDFFSPETLGYVQQSEEVRNKLIGLRLDIQDKINTGQLRGQAIFDYAKSKLTPEELPLLDTDSLLEQQKFATAEEGKSERVTQQGQIALGKQLQAQQASPQVEYNDKVAGEAVKFNAAGGKEGLMTKINKIDSVINDLKTKNLKTRTAVALGTSALGGRGQGLLAPKLKNAKATINGAIEIKKILDSQFSDAIMKETQQNLGLDENLSEEDNIKRLEALRDQLKGEVEGKIDEFKRLNLYRESKSKSKTYNIGGVIMSPEQAKKFYQTNTQFKPDAKTKEELGL